MNEKLHLITSRPTKYGYAVTSDGKVWSYKTKRFLKPQKLSCGYLQVCLSTNKTRANIHRLVAETLIPNPNNYPEVNHKDGIKANNDVSNLEWCTHKQNLAHARATGLIKYNYGEAVPNSKLKDYQVHNIRHLYNSGLSGPKIAKLYGKPYPTIKDVVSGKQWKHLLCEVGL